MKNSYEEVKRLRKLILLAATRAGEGHVASAFSILDVLYTLYNGIVSHDPKDPGCPTRDYVILSKGHGCLALYAVLADCGFFSPDSLENFCQPDSRFGGHPDRTKVRGVEASTGSLGHGLPLAVGIAKGYQIQNSANHVFCLVGDGELNEGSNWEAAMLATQHKLDNLTLIVDFNHSGDRAIDPRPTISDKLQAFGFTVAECDGHDHKTIRSRLLLRPLPKTPMAIVMNTIKGKGITEMENNPAWHHRAPTIEEYARFSKILS